MDLFKFIPGSDPTDLVQGEAINGATSVMWAERYRDPGEFEITAPMSSGLWQFLPLGTMISHTNTLEVMIVENVNIKDEELADPILSITGRSLEVVLDRRIVGSNLASNGVLLVPYTTPAWSSWDQAVAMINEHIQTPVDPNDRLPNFYAQQSIAGSGTTEPRTIGRISLHKALLELLGVDNVGVKIIRKNPFGVGSSTATLFMLHKGVDRTSSVVFSWKAGDLESAEYLWSNRTYSNSAIVVGRYVNVRIHTSADVGYGRAITVVPADDIDGHFDAAPAGATLNDVVNAMGVRGRAVLSGRRRINLVRADISEISKYHYRQDYDIGDIVTVDGNFGEIAPMRVIEYVEIQDENEEKGHPTLETPNPAQ